MNPLDDPLDSIFNDLSALQSEVKQPKPKQVKYVIVVYNIQ